MISILHFKELGAWAICNAEMMFAILNFLTNVERKQLGMVTMFTTLKEIVSLSIHLFTNFIIHDNTFFVLRLAFTTTY
jgi:hypothetical protein